MPPPDTEALQLVHEGWNHLELQRPLAAWACWQRALRSFPEFAASRQALSILETAPDLPRAARRSYAFRAPANDLGRARWDERLRERDLNDLAAAAAAFAALAAADPTDASAWYNHALCLAWQGRNVEAIADLDRVTRLEAGLAPDCAVEAWTLAEILRQGAGAESLADDLNYAWTLEGCNEPAIARLVERPELRPVAVPPDLASDPSLLERARVFEWLDRPLGQPDSDRRLSACDLPRVLANVLSTPPTLRLSSPDPRTLEQLDPHLLRSVSESARPIHRSATPLALPFLDAAVWTFRLPPGLDDETRGQLSRAAVESYYENIWIHLPRQGLDGRTPLAAGQAANSGDVVARIKLAAVVRLREQLGARPRTSSLYQGYPFDRLRRRLGLERNDHATVESEDCSCMSGDELDRLDPRALDDGRLADAFESSAGLRVDARSALFAAELVCRRTSSLGRLGLPSVLAPLVREALRCHEPERALGWLDEARDLNGGRDRSTLDTWKAEIHARAGEPAAALGIYRALIEHDPAPAARALDAAETLLDNGYPDLAQPWLLLARDQARRAGDDATIERAEALLGGDEGIPERPPEA
jgi:tetratricopeptide (TPR) repeat protein